MSAESAPPPRRRHYGWWIASAVFAVLAGLGAYITIEYGEAIQMVYGWFRGNPTLPGCTAAGQREATAGRLWYRVVELSCRNNGSAHIMYAKPANGFMMPVFFSANGPGVASVRETQDGGLEIVLTAPLADGRSAVPLEIDKNGFVTKIYTFYEGRPADAPQPKS
jgi:hypothetical protein